MTDDYDHTKIIAIYTILGIAILGIVVSFLLLKKREMKDPDAVDEISLQSLNPKTRSDSDFEAHMEASLYKRVEKRNKDLEVIVPPSAYVSSVSAARSRGAKEDMWLKLC